MFRLVFMCCPQFALIAFQMHCGSLQCLLIIYVKQTICGALQNILQSSLVLFFKFFIFDYGSLHIARCCVIKIIRHVVDESVHF